MDSVKCRLSMPRLTVKARVRSSPIDSLCARHKQNIREIPLNSNANILVLLKEVIWLPCLRPNIHSFPPTRFQQIHGFLFVNYFHKLFFFTVIS